MNLDNRQNAPIRRHAARNAGKGIFGNRRAQHTVGIIRRKAARCAIGATLEAMHIFAEDHDALIGFHAARHDIGHRIDETGILHQLAGEAFLLFKAHAIEFRKIAAQAEIAEALFRPERRNDAALAVTHLDQLASNFIHQRNAAFPQGLDRIFAERLSLQKRFGQRIKRVAAAPFCFLVLGAIAEGAARKRAVLVEIAIDIGFDDGRAIACAHNGIGLLGGEPDGYRIHAIHLERRNAEGKPARGKARLCRHFLHMGGNGITIVLDEEADRQFPCSRKVHGFQNRTDIGRAIAEIGVDDIALASAPMRPCRACRHGHAAADDGIGAEITRFSPAQMHGAATATAEALRKPQNFGQRALRQRTDILIESRLGVDALLRNIAERLCQKLMARGASH